MAYERDHQRSPLRGRHIERCGGSASAGVLPGQCGAPGGHFDVRGDGLEDKDPRKSLHVQEVPTPELGAGRGARRRDGQRDQLQHRLDLDLRAGVDVRLPASATARPRRCGQAHDLPYHVRRLRPGRRGAAHRPGRDRWQPGRRGRRALPVRRAGGPARATTTRCSTPSSASGASRPTSAAWPSSRW